MTTLMEQKQGTIAHIHVGCWMIILLSVASPIYAGPLQIVAVSGRPAPGASEGAVFTLFPGPTINARGEVLFAASLTGDLITQDNDAGYWYGGKEGLQPLAVEGEPVPGGTEGEVWAMINSSSRLFINDVGETAFAIHIAVPEEDRLFGSIWMGSPGRLRQVISADTSAPGRPSDDRFFWMDVSRGSPNNAGNVLFHASVRSTNPDEPNRYGRGIWLARDNGLDAIVINGLPAPGFPDGAVFSDRYLAGTLTRSTSMSAEVVFRAKVTQPGIRFDQSAIYEATSGALRLLAGPPTSTSAEIWASLFSGPNIEGQVAFRGSLRDPDTAEVHRAIFVEEEEGFRVVAEVSQPVPGFVEEYVWDSFYYNPRIGDGGHVGFYGSIADSSNALRRRSGVFVDMDGRLEVLALSGDPAPGTDFAFSKFSRNAPSFNAHGQVVFPVSLVPPDDSSRLESLWATDRQGDLKLIAVEGQTIALAADDVRTISRIQFANMLSSNDYPVINNRGQIAFGVSFSDGGRAVLISNVVAVPEPSMMVLVTVSIVVSMLVGPVCRTGP